MNDLCCPKCDASLTVKEAVVILNGSGYRRTAKIKLPDGRIEFVPANLVNPNEVEVLE